MSLRLYGREIYVCYWVGKHERFGQTFSQIWKLLHEVEEEVQGDQRVPMAPRLKMENL